MSAAFGEDGGFTPDLVINSSAERYLGDCNCSGCTVSVSGIADIIAA